MRDGFHDSSPLTKFMKNIKLSSEQERAAAIWFYDFYKSLAEIARRFDVPPSRIKYFLEKVGDYERISAKIHGARTARGHFLAKGKR